MSLNIELSNKQINIQICENTLKMLYRRNLIDSIDEKFEEINNQINNKASIDFVLNNNTKCSIYIVSAKLTSIVNGTPLDEFLRSNTEIHKLIIIKEFTKKVAKQILDEYKNAEFFFEHELLEDIPSKVFIPEHQLLSNAEKTELFTKFNETELSIIYTTDTMARYYNARVGDIFRIIRPSVTSGKSIFYRRVINGSLDLIF
jgi:DNA-directed RNA polymerase subunit H (RpoH/RPB5)